jgi:hypothetical protein
MKIIEPWLDNEFSMSRIKEALRVLAGEPLGRIRYVGSGFDVPELYSPYAGFDTVLKGVELTNSSHVVTVMWMMEGVREGLGFVLDPEEEFYEDESLHVIDVSHAPRWTSLLHVPVVSSGTSWHVSDDDAPKSIWSFRLSFGKEESVTIALGEVNELGSGLTYQPDSVAVIFDEAIARRYRILASSESAWGSHNLAAEDVGSATVRDFAHGTSMENAQSILNNGLN